MVSTAAGMARHGLLPVVNSFASFLASRANEQIYNQASEGSKVIYALHYAGLIPAGPGKSHQSVRDISLLAALPNVTIVQPGSWEETRRAGSLGGRGGGRERRDPPRDRPFAAADRASRGGPADRAGQRAARRRRRGADLLRAGDAPRGARSPPRSWRRAGSCRYGSSRMPWLNRFDADWLAAEVAPFDHVFVLEDHAPVGGLGDGLRAALPGRAVTVFGVEGWPACGTPDEALRFHGLDGASLAARIAPRRPPSRQSRLARRSMTKRTWVVLPDLLSIRVFFDTGIVGGLRARLDGSLAAVFLVPREASGGVGRSGSRASGARAETRSRPRTGSLDRVLARVDASLDRQLGYHPLAIRLNHRHGFHAERMQPGHPNWMLDTDRDGPLPHWRAVERAMERWFFSPRRHVPSPPARRRCGATAPASCSRTSSPRARCRSSPRRGGCGCRWSAHVASWDHTVGKGVISPYCDLYIVQNRVMEDDLRRYHGIEPERVRVTGWPQTDLFHRRRPRAEYDELLRRYGLDPGRPLVARRREHAEQRAVRGALRRASRRVVGADLGATASQLLFRPHPRDGRWRERFAAAAGRERRRRAGGELHRPRRPRDAAPARRRRRLQRRDDPPRRARRRPSGRLRALRRGGAAGGVVGCEERRRQALRGARGVRRVLSRRALRGGRRRHRARARAAGTSSLRQRRRAVEQVVGVVDGHAAERVVDGDPRGGSAGLSLTDRVPAAPE